jgi:hypothetical protein
LIRTESPVARPWGTGVVIAIGLSFVAPATVSHCGIATFAVVARLVNAAFASLLNWIRSIPSGRSSPRVPSAPSGRALEPHRSPARRERTRPRDGRPSAAGVARGGSSRSTRATLVPIECQPPNGRRRGYGSLGGRAGRHPGSRRRSLTSFPG